MLKLAAIIVISAVSSRFETREWKPEGAEQGYHYRLFIPEAAKPPAKDTVSATSKPTSIEGKTTETEAEKESIDVGTGEVKPVTSEHPGKGEQVESKSTPKAIPAGSDSPPNSQQRWPLLLWIHGQGERGNDNSKNLRWIELTFEPFENSPPFFILVPQQQKRHRSWSRSGEEQAGDMLSITYQTLREVIAEFPIDEDRIYVSGVSSGGTACWEIAARYPGVFAAVAPLSSAGCDSSKVGQLKQIPIWAFHCKVDTLTRPDGVQTTVEVIRQAGGLAHLTLTERFNGNGWTHDSWTPAFREQGLAEWLLTQRKSDPLANWPPPEVSASTLEFRAFVRETPWGQVAAWFGLSLMVVTACWMEFRRRRRARYAERPLPPVFDTGGQNLDRDFGNNPQLSN
jgi:predicted peptidase